MDIDPAAIVTGCPFDIYGTTVLELICFDQDRGETNGIDVLFHDFEYVSFDPSIEPYHSRMVWTFFHINESCHI